MRNKIFTIAIASLLFSLASCTSDADVTDYMPEDPELSSSDYAEYKIRQVLLSNDSSEESANCVSEEAFAFFETVYLRLYFEEDEPVYLEYSDGDAPFSPFNFNGPVGKVECELNTEVEPNELRVKSGNQLIAVLENGEWAINFNVDSRHLNYKYTFKTAELTLNQ